MPDLLPVNRVLVVDDDTDVRELVCRILRPVSKTVTALRNTADALAALKAEEFDVVLVDLDLSEGCGLEILDAVSVSGREASAVLLTGTNDVSVAVAAMKRGATDYLPKPLSVAELRRVVDRAAREARSRRRERQLESLVADWTATFDACPDFMLVLDGDRKILKSNRAVQQFAGRCAEELHGLTPQEIFSGELSAALTAAIPDGLPVKVLDRGPDRHYVLTLNPIHRTAFIAVIREVTDLVKAEATQARLYRKLLTAQEEERGRIARELHDGIAQSIVSLSLGLKTASDRLPGGESERLAGLSQTACEVLDEIRGLARGLRPRVLDDLGLVAAIERLTGEFGRQSNVAAEFTPPSGPNRRIPAVLELNVYRIVQEALSNVARHAEAKSVAVVLEFSDHTVAASVSDDGNGSASDRGFGMGLADMRERTELLGGSFKIRSVPGQGTAIRFEIPIRVTAV